MFFLLTFIDWYNLVNYLCKLSEVALIIVYNSSLERSGSRLDWLALHLKVGSGRGLRRNITATSYNSHNSPNLSSTLKKNYAEIGMNTLYIMNVPM